MHWINLIQDLDSWKAFVNMPINLLSFIKCRDFHDELRF